MHSGSNMSSRELTDPRTPLLDSITNITYSLFSRLPYFAGRAG